MPTTKEKKFKKPIFKVAKELNISTDSVVEFLEAQGYGDTLKGKGLAAKITREEAYLVLRQEYADDAEAAARVRELRAREADAEQVDRDEVASITPEEAAAAEAAEAEAAADEAPVETPVAETVDAPAAEAPPAEALADEEAPATPAPEAAAVEAGDATPEAPDTEGAAPEAEAAAPVEAEAAADVPADAPPETVAADAAAPAEPEAETVDAPEAAVETAEAEAETSQEETSPEQEEAPAPAASAETEGAEAEAPAEAEPVEAEPVEAEPVEAVDAEADLAEDDLDEEDEDDGDEEEDEEEGTLKADRYRLSGPSVVGKVDLSSIQPKRRRKRKKKKGADSSSSGSKKREDRKQQKPQRKKKRKKKRRRRGVDEEDVEQTIQETLQELEQGASRARQRRRRRRRERHAIEREEARQRRAERESVVRVTEFVSTGELANLMGEPVTEVIKTLFEAGMMVSINQRLDADTIEFIAAEYDLDVEFIDEFSSTAIELEEDAPEDLARRAPVVTVMGHVDHGKTSLLDYIRKANVVAGEAGGITQHIGAYNVELASTDGAITFLDTPGHEAFTAMRARGAKATDVVILVVAADDAVMPQTIEAINHSQAADVPLVVAINKVDKSSADPQRVMTELAEHNVLVEDYGGTVQSANVSAETGEGMGELMEKVLLQSELLELKANPDRMAAGTIIESRLEKGRGNVVTVLVQNGTLQVGDPFVAGIYSGRVRAMFNERDQRIDEAGPSTPALILGCDGSPDVGDQFVAMEDEGEARDIAQRRQQIHREQQLRQKNQVSLEQISRRMAEGEFHELNLIVKADVGGSVEALADALLKLKTDEVAVNIIHSGVGAINESDVMLARASEAVILGFQVRPTSGARATAEQEDIDVRTYSVIYDAIEEVHDALEGLLSPARREETQGYAEVRDIFKVSGVGTIAGCYVTEGTISRNHQIRVVREGVVIYDGEIASLKRFQDDVKEVQSGYECGMSVQNFNDIKVGDELETYIVVEEKRTLEV